MSYQSASNFVSHPLLITPSLLAYNDWVQFDKLLVKLNQEDIDGLHIDVMDGHFVPNLAFGPNLVSSIKRHTHHPLDIHLMINCLDVLLQRYIDIRPRVIFIHPEVCTNNCKHYIDQIKSAGIELGIAIHPDYPIDQTQPFWSAADRMLIMTVYPGFSGQNMIPQHLSKISYLKDHGYQGACWVDGGVSFDKFDMLKKYHTDGVIMGNSYFANCELKSDTMNQSNI